MNYKRFHKFSHSFVNTGNITKFAVSYSGVSFKIRSHQFLIRQDLHSEQWGGIGKLPCTPEWSYLDKNREVIILNLKTERYRRKKNIHKVVEHHVFNTKKYLVHINAKNRMAKCSICFIVISYAVLPQNLNARRIDYFFSEKWV